MEVTEEFVSLRGAARHCGCTPRTIRKVVQRGDLETFRDPLRPRVHWVRVADLEALRQRRPAGSETRQAEAAA